MNKIYNGVATEFEDYFDKLIDSEKKQVELYYSAKKEEVYEQKIKELKHKIKVNEKCRRKMQQSLMKEIERLNNIINGMEKFFQYAYDNKVRPLNDRKVSVWTICLDKLKELKENNK